MTPKQISKSIKYWAEDDKPREKLANKGKDSLSNSELLAILIGSGNKEESAIDLAKRLLETYNHSLIELSKAGIKSFQKMKGIGLVKAITIEAALELGRRRLQSEVGEKPVITRSDQAYQLIRSYLEDISHEEFYIILLNRAQMVLSIERISSGGMSSTVVDPKMVFARALECKAHNIILCHNHPSHSRKPSQADIQLTEKLSHAGELLEIKVVDHLIVCADTYFSFADEGMLK
ncbi:MAG: DNA repair protein RadC [Saprospiraceae bacterium]|jgi:DNA repair protein RadC|nr:DNA repair protein RadC [Saprospiraceae bacterium]MBK7795745.1 DNA repair protein RadC [Saprospiraceae bacterium]MBK8154293.1 DNA repair protein RadC [Saprospiraceae bacterium]MBK9379464.1 DNA repair protein RadC [Saprospiraceae bacterium]MBL0260857.1 DNA repair protein RadC [Saprospiraceae bacterium]